MTDAVDPRQAASGGTATPGSPLPVSASGHLALSPAESAELSQKWDSQFREIQQARTVAGTANLSCLLASLSPGLLFCGSWRGPLRSGRRARPPQGRAWAGAGGQLYARPGVGRACCIRTVINHIRAAILVRTNTTASEEKIEKLMELMDLKNLALEGMEAKVRKVLLPVVGARARVHALR